MAIEVIALNSDSVANTYGGTKAFINSFMTRMQTEWPWTDSEITEADSVLTGKFYFKENVYMQITFSASSGTAPGLAVSFHAPNVSAENCTIFSYAGSGYRWWQVSMAKGASGFALAITINTSAPTTAKATNYTMFFGKCISTNNEEKYGAVLTGNSSRRIVDEDGAIPDNVYKISCNNSASYKAILSPVCNPATGAIFRNIYEPKFCAFLFAQFTLCDKIFQAGASVSDPCLSDE